MKLNNQLIPEEIETHLKTKKSNSLDLEKMKSLMSDSDSEGTVKRDTPKHANEPKSPVIPKLNLLAALPENRSSKSSIKSIHDVKEESNPFIPKIEVKEEVKLLED